MLFRIFRPRLLAIAALSGAALAGPAPAAVFDVSIGGTMTGIRFGSFATLPSEVGDYLESGNVFSADFTLDVTGNTINSVTGSVTFDGLSGDVTGFGSNSGGSTFRGFFLQFEELADGSGNVGDVSIDDIDFRMNATSGQTFEDLFNAALTNGSAIFRSSVVAAFRFSSASTSFHRGQLDNDGVLQNQAVALAATVPVPAGLMLMLTGFLGFGFLLRGGVRETGSRFLAG